MKSGHPLKQMILSALQPVVFVLVGVGLGLLFTMLAGENPWNVLQILFRSSFGTWYDLGLTLFYSSCLVFTGLSVMVAYQGGLFNVGAEGQLTMGALAAAAVGILFPDVPPSLAPLLATLAAFTGGFLWASLAGALRAYRGCHEVISTIMLNFIGAGLANWVTLYLLKNPHSQNPETAEVGKNYLLTQLAIFDGSPVSTALFVGPLVALALKYFLWNTTWGFQIRATGQNEKAAEMAGMKVPKIYFWTLSLSGGLAGLVGLVEILGNAGKFKIGFSPGLGFMGIAVALLGRSRPLGVLCAAFLFGALHKGSLDLDFETENISRELSQILQALVILSVSAAGLWDVYRKKKAARIFEAKSGAGS